MDRAGSSFLDYFGNLRQREDRSNKAPVAGPHGPTPTEDGASSSVSILVNLSPAPSAELQHPLIVSPKPAPYHGSKGSKSEGPSAITSELVYCVAGASTILFNKHVLSTFRFPAPNTLLFFQFLLAVLLLQAAHATSIIHLEPLRWDLVKVWLPVNLVFVAMNVTGFLALQLIGAGMFTILKNLSTLLTIGGEYLILGRTYSWKVWLCLALMIFSACLGGWTDHSFNLVGYAWQMINCCFTAAYSLCLSDAVQSSTDKGKERDGVLKKDGGLDKGPGDKKLSQHAMVYYNNALAVIPFGLIALASNEIKSLRTYPELGNLEFQIVALMGGLMGLVLSFSSIWCMSRTSATIYSLTGSMNKVIVALVGMWYFQEPTNLLNMCSIGVGLAAGILYVFAAKGPMSSPAGAAAAGAGGSPAIAAGAAAWGKQ